MSESLLQSQESNNNTTIEKGRGRPKGSKDKKPRKPYTKKNKSLS